MSNAGPAGALTNPGCALASCTTACAERSQSEPALPASAGATAAGKRRTRRFLKDTLLAGSWPWSANVPCARRRPPAVPLGGWDLGKQATVGDLTVCFCQLLGISPITPGGQAPTANDYQSAMLGIGVSNPASVQAAITAALPNWTPVGLSPFGPSPTNSPVRTQN